jgi:hypothetical protein
MGWRISAGHAAIHTDGGPPEAEIISDPVVVDSAVHSPFKIALKRPGVGQPGTLGLSSKSMM